MGRAFEYRRASKEKRWDKMSKLYPRLARSIEMAAREGGSDPESNTKLRAAISTAKAQNMPKENVFKAIKRATEKNATAYEEANYEGKGPHGVLIWVECATDNPTRTVANVRTAFNKGKGQMLSSGALEFMFARKVVIEAVPSDEVDLEEVELTLIDHGLEEVDRHEERVYLTGDFTAFGSLTKACEDLGLEVEKAGLQRISTNPVEFSEEQIQDIEALIDRLDDDDDVQAVYTNIA